METFIYIAIAVIFIIVYFFNKGNKLTNTYLKHLYEYRQRVLEDPYSELSQLATLDGFPMIARIVKNFEKSNDWGVDRLSEQEFSSLYSEISKMIIAYIGVNIYPNNKNFIAYTSEDVNKNIKFSEEFTISMLAIVKRLSLNK